MKNDSCTSVVFHLVVTSVRSLVFVGVMAISTLFVLESQSVTMGEAISQLQSMGQSFGDALN